MPKLPRQPTPFVGRRRELVEIGRLVADPSCRLLALTGPGGIGKTRLALATAEQSEHQFRDGVALVPLQGVLAADGLVSAIADALQITFHGAGEPEIQLVERLRERQILLILDNLEHLLVDPGLEIVVRFLSNLLQSAPGAKVIATSRDVLHIQQEWVFPVRGLSLAPGGDEPGGEAIDLFVDRARRARANFSLEQEELGVKRICAMVEGNPLALELAAAWTRTLSCSDIADEIERDLAFLTSQQRNASKRHVSMQAVFDQSWSRLNEEERRVLQRMSIFRGGCERNAAQQVADARLPVLAALIGKSLLRRTAAGRYEVHELLRQYAAGHWDEYPEDRTRTERQHATYYLTMLRELIPDMQGSRQNEALETLGADIQNVFAAWRQAVRMGDDGALINTAEGLIHFCELSGRFRDGLTLFKLAVGRYGTPHEQAKAPTERAALKRDEGDKQKLILAQMQTGQGMCLLRLGRLAESESLLEESVANLRRVEPEDPKAMALALYWLGHTFFWQGHYGIARQTLLESLAYYTALEDTWGIGASAYMVSSSERYQGRLDETDRYLAISEEKLRSLGERRLAAFCISSRGLVFHQRGDYARAGRYLLEGLVIRRELRDLWSIGYSTRDLGYVAIAQGNYPAARMYFEESLAAFKETGAYGNTIFPLDALGTMARIQGDFMQAESLHRQAFAISQEIGERRGEALCCSNLGILASLQGDPVSAEELLRLSLKTYSEIGHRIGVGFASSRLGVVIGGQAERLDEAAKYFVRALDIAMDTGAVPLALDVLLRMATLLGADSPTDDQQALSIDFLLVVGAHTASTHEMKRQAEQILATVADSQLSSERLELAETLTAARRQLEAWTTGAPVAPETGSPTSPDWLEPLTPREIEVLQLVEQGLSNREIAERLVITVGTVKWYTNQIYSKLRARNRSEAVHIARQFGLLP